MWPWVHRDMCECGHGCIETCVSVWPWVYKDMCECVAMGV